MTSLASFAIPFKLGELVRAYEVVRLTGVEASSLFSVWIDRLFDAFFLCIVLGFLLATGDSTSGTRWIFGIASGFLLLSTTVALALPGALRSFSLTLMNSTSTRSLWALRAVAALRNLLTLIRKPDRQRISLLVFLTTAIWVIEAAVIALTVGARPEPAASFLSEAAATIAGATMLVGSKSTDETYRSIAEIGLSIMALVTAPIYLRWRWRKPRRHYGWSRPYRTHPFGATEVFAGRER